MLRRLLALRVFVILLALIALPALACDFSFSTASITNGVTARDVRGNNYDPVGITDTFMPDQAVFHAVVSLKDAPKDTAVKAVWTAIEASGGIAPNTKLAETELKADGTRNLDFTLTPNSGRLPPGSYKVEIFLNNKLDRTLNFVVVAPTPTPIPPTATPRPATATPAPTPTPVAKPSAFVRSVTLATGATTDTKAPVNPTSEFRPNATFHAIVATQNAPAGTRFRAMWYASDIGLVADPNTLIDQTQLTADGTRNIDFTLTPTNNWPPGKYRVEIFVNDVLDRAVQFTVAGTIAQPAPAPTQSSPSVIRAVTLATDSKPDTKEPVNPTTEFKPNAIFHAIVTIENAPANTKIKVVWYAADVGNVVPLNTRIDQVELTADGSRNLDFLLQPSAAWPPGKYRVEIFVNGALDRKIDFSVK